MSEASTNNDARTIRVILLRHGEREDETEDYDKDQHTYQERIDPALTSFGHRQALNAWKKIVQCLPTDKPVLIASSPLRRCIGTAMMAAAAVTPECPLRFVLPSDPNEDSCGSVPILVMNGLGDCAAQMQTMEGIGKVVKAGWLQCAASPGNDCFSGEERQPQKTTPIQRCLSSICGTAVEFQSKLLPGQPGVPLKFWRESQYCYERKLPIDKVVPLTSCQTLHDHATGPSQATTQCSSRNNSHTPSKMPKNAPSRDETIDSALTRAVLQTAHSGLDTCILVTHREAIRYVEDHWSHTHPNKKATKMYCCVAVYHVSVDTSKSQVLGWKNLSVVPYQLLKPETMGIVNNN